MSGQLTGRFIAPSAQTLELESTQQLSASTDTVRRQLIKRLADAICLPESKLTPQKRHMTGDVLVELLRSTEADIRESVTKRLVMRDERLHQKKQTCRHQDRAQYDQESPQSTNFLITLWVIRI